MFFILYWKRKRNQQSGRQAALWVNAGLLDVDPTVPDCCKREWKKSTFWRVHRGKDTTISYGQVIRKSGTAWGTSCGPRGGGGAGAVERRLKFPAYPPAFMFCLQTLLTLHHTVDISCAYGPMWRRVLTAAVTSVYKKKRDKTVKISPTVRKRKKTASLKMSLRFITWDCLACERVKSCENNKILSNSCLSWFNIKGFAFMVNVNTEILLNKSNSKCRHCKDNPPLNKRWVIF